MEVPVLMGKSPRNLKNILGLDFPIFHDFSRFLHRNNSLVVAFDLRNEPHDIPGVAQKNPRRPAKMGISGTGDSGYITIV